MVNPFSFSNPSGYDDPYQKITKKSPDLSESEVKAFCNARDIKCITENSSMNKLNFKLDDYVAIKASDGIKKSGKTYVYIKKSDLKTKLQGQAQVKGGRHSSGDLA